MGRKVGIGPDDIVAAAAAIADADGLEAVTLARVAADLGVKSPSLYNHISGLDGLLDLLRLEGFTASLAVLAAVDDDDPAARLRGVAAAVRSFATTHPGLYAASQIGIQRGDSARVVELIAAGIEIVAEPLRELGVPEDELIHTIRAFRAMVHGFIDLEASGGFGLPEEVDVSFDLAIELLLHSVDAV